MTYHSCSTEQTETIAAMFAKTVPLGTVITLSGELGAGKTAFARGFLAGRGFVGRVTSPTFSIVSEYETPTATVVHCDLYRLSDEEEVFATGFADYLRPDTIVLVEWSERAGDLIPKEHTDITITYGKNPDDRTITIREGNA